MVPGRQVRCMSQEAEFHETLRKLAMIRQGFIQDKARPALDLTKPSALYPKMTALPGFRAVIVRRRHLTGAANSGWRQRRVSALEDRQSRSPLSLQAVLSVRVAWVITDGVAQAAIDSCLTPGVRSDERERRFHRCRQDRSR